MPYFTPPSFKALFINFQNINIRLYTSRNEHAKARYNSLDSE